MIRRSLTLFAGLFVLILVIGWLMGLPFTSSRLVEAAAYSLIALGLNIQWGYGGLFNFGIMGFLMLGGAAVTLAYAWFATRSMSMLACTNAAIWAFWLMPTSAP